MASIYGFYYLAEQFTKTRGPLGRKSPDFEDSFQAPFWFSRGKHNIFIFSSNFLGNLR